MPLMPKRTKHRKVQKGRNRGKATRGWCSATCSNKGYSDSLKMRGESDKYDFVNMMHYRTSLALMKNMADSGTFNESEYRKICTMLNKKHGLSSNSIFAENT